jgi:hypothetical protein
MQTMMATFHKMAQTAIAEIAGVLARTGSDEADRMCAEILSVSHHDDRTHLGLAKSTPAGRKEWNNPDPQGKVVSMPRLGGLHHRYDLAA